MNFRKHTVLKVAVIGAFALFAFSALPAGACPNSPGTLSASACNTKVVLTWSAPSGGTAATGYVVFRSASPTATAWNTPTVPLNLSKIPAGWTMIVTQANDLTATTYTDTGLTNGTKYSYEVAGYDSGGIGYLSNLAAATPESGLCGTPTPIGAIGAIPAALLLGGVLVYQQHRRRIRRTTVAETS
jgi:hypothetical protein